MMMSPGLRSVLAPRSPFFRRSAKRTVKSSLFSVHMTYDFRSVTRGVRRQSTGRNHSVQHGHVSLVGNRFGSDCLAYNSNLFVVGAHKVSDDDGNDGIGNKFFQTLLDVTAKLLGRFSRSNLVIDEGG